MIRTTCALTVALLVGACGDDRSSSAATGGTMSGAATGGMNSSAATGGTLSSAATGGTQNSGNAGKTPSDAPAAGVRSDGGDGGGSDPAEGATGAVPSGGSPPDSGGHSSGGAGNSAAAGRAGSGTTPARTLEFVVDSSASNNERQGSTTRWELTQSILRQTFADLDPATVTSLIFFPKAGLRRGSSECIEGSAAVPFAVTDAGQLQRLDTALASRVPEGVTPTHDAFRFAIESLLEAGFGGDRYVVLVTDGVPTVSLQCMGTEQADPVDPAPLIVDIESTLTQHGVRTIVVGTPGSEDARATLSHMAIAGGTAPEDCHADGPNFCHIDLTVDLDLSGHIAAALSLHTQARLGGWNRQTTR